MVVRIMSAVIILLALFRGGSAVSEEIMLVSLKNEFQAEVLRQAADHALTRVDNQFLVALNSEQIEILTRAGLEVEPVMSDADMYATYLVRPGRINQMSALDKASMPGSVDIGGGMRVARLSSSEAKSLTEQNNLLVSPLTDLSARITYMPRAVATLLAQVADFPTDSLADLVSQDSIYAYDTRLEAFRTRYIYTDSIIAARNWIAQKFHDWGYTDVTTPSFYYNGWMLYNVMAIKPGYAEPDAVIVIGGHYDSITYGQTPGPYEYAPGADDNGTGSVTSMVLSRILNDVPLRKNVIFLSFTSEEV